MNEIYGAGVSGELTLDEAVEESLTPRGLNPLLYDLVESFGLAPGAMAVDVGAREGYHCFELARRFGLRVRGVEPLRLHLDNAAEALRTLAIDAPEVAARIRIEEGVAEHLTDADHSVDLVWCRDMLIHVEDVAAAFREFGRVLKPGGHALVFEMTATEWLTPQEAARLWPALGTYATSVDARHLESAMAAGSLAIEQCIELHGEIREWDAECDENRTAQQLLWASRLLRNRAEYEARFGTEEYQTVLADSLWGVYQMIGKLNPRIYVLTPA